MKAYLSLLINALEVQAKALAQPESLQPLSWTGLNPRGRNRESSFVLLLLWDLELFFFLDELAVLLDLLLHSEDLHIDWGELSPKAFVFKDLLVDLSHDLFFTLEALLIR